MRKEKLSQHGIVSLVITVILMVVISLVVLSFAKISRREQRSALDRQLSTQAFYAAESGINDARNALKSWSEGDSRFNSDYMDKCVGPGSFTEVALTLPEVFPTGQPLPGSGQAAYTCVFVDASPTRLVYATSDDQHVIPVIGKNNAIINNLEIFWDNGAPVGFTGCGDPASGNPLTWPNNCGAPILRVELVDASSAAGLLDSKVFFIWPSVNSGGSLGYGSSSGEVAQAPCSPPVSPTRPNRCRIQVTGLNSAKYYMRIKGLYAPLAATVTANNETVELVGAQSLIDVTGRASDVERRIQVRVKLGNQGNNLPLFGLAATDKICKRFTINGTTATDQATPTCWSLPDTPN